jgi:hypothetical protein
MREKLDNYCLRFDMFRYSVCHPSSLASMFVLSVLWKNIQFTANSDTLANNISCSIHSPQTVEKLLSDYDSKISCNHDQYYRHRISRPAKTLMSIHPSKALAVFNSATMIPQSVSR